MLLLCVCACEGEGRAQEGHCFPASFSSPPPSSFSEAALQSLHSAAFSSGAEYLSLPEDVASNTAALEQTLEQVEVRMRSVVHARDKKRKVRNGSHLLLRVRELVITCFGSCEVYSPEGTERRVLFP